MAACLPSIPSFLSLSTALSSSYSHDLPPTPKVRFDQECVLIPDPVPMSRLPRLVTKSYSLPLWKRKRDSSLASEPEDEPSEDHVVFRVSVPSITTKVRSSSRGDAARPLVSCLVHTDPSSSISARTSSPPRIGRPRRASLPAPVQHTETITVPLRACCTQCYSSIDKCTKAGEHWEVHFSRGALRRRKSVSDAHTPSRTHHCVRDAMPGFDAIVAVDEVDRRRKSTDVDALTALTIEMSTRNVEEIPLRRALSLPDAVHPTRARLLSDLVPRGMSPPILEEDEFRPSPRRTPVVSPFSSSTNLPATHMMHALEDEKVSMPNTPSLTTEVSPEKSVLNLDTVLSSSRLTSSPLVFEKDSTPWYAAHEHVFTDSPTSSPSSSPQISNARTPSALEHNVSRKKPLIQLSGSIFRASTSVFKGISSMGGPPMSV